MVKVVEVAANGSVRSAYRNGDLAAAFIHKDARAILDSGEGQ